MQCSSVSCPITEAGTDAKAPPELPGQDCLQTALWVNRHQHGIRCSNFAVGCSEKLSSSHFSVIRCSGAHLLSTGNNCSVSEQMFLSLNNCPHGVCWFPGSQLFIPNNSASNCLRSVQSKCPCLLDLHWYEQRYSLALFSNTGANQEGSQWSVKQMEVRSK